MTATCSSKGHRRQRSPLNLALEAVCLGQVYVHPARMPKRRGIRQPVHANLRQVQDWGSIWIGGLVGDISLDSFNVAIHKVDDVSFVRGVQLGHIAVSWSRCLVMESEATMENVDLAWLLVVILAFWCLLRRGRAELLERLCFQHRQELQSLRSLLILSGLGAESSPRWPHLVSDQLLISVEEDRPILLVLALEELTINVAFVLDAHGTLEVVEEPRREAVGLGHLEPERRLGLEDASFLQPVYLMAPFQVVRADNPLGEPVKDFRVLHELFIHCQSVVHLEGVRHSDVLDKFSLRLPGLGRRRVSLLVAHKHRPRTASKSINFRLLLLAQVGHLHRVALR